ncbi:hypothetical protein DB30_05220 [Enhygromyxa salina]|uniref:WD40 repeat domain-containing protein n=1 Tax=Enhygromyxa salina TaxID=215803 RepID=A0A0C2D6Z6_9BACT|nr:hypothetical protein [Enhygromyxa salina]KIG15802.1 hypothetical protein DB30_05220 [Enhygromyxa salina]
MFDYDREGKRIVLTDGAELLVHDGESEAPLWRHTESSDIVGVASLEDRVVSVDSDGRVCWRDARSGDQLAQVQLDGTPRALAAGPKGQVAVALPDSVAIMTAGQLDRHIAVDDPRCLAWSPEGKLGVGSGTGTAYQFGSGETNEFNADLPGPIGAIAWNEQGLWVMSVAHDVFRLSSESLGRVTGTPDDTPIQNLACSPGGHYIAIQCSPSLILVLEYPSRETDAQVRYPDREITGLRFGPPPWLGVGLVGGDGNKFNLDNGGTNRTDTHEGRDHNRWMVMVNATRSERESPAPSSGAPAVAADEAEEETTPLQGIIGVLVLIAILATLYFWLS